MANSSSIGSLSRYIEPDLDEVEKTRAIAELTGKQELTDKQAKAIVEIHSNFLGGNKGNRDFLDLLYIKHRKLWAGLFYTFRYELSRIPKLVAALETNSRCGLCGSRTTQSFVCKQCSIFDPKVAKAMAWQLRDKKTKATILKKYGEQGLANPKTQSKRRKTCLKKYGTEHPAQSDIVKAKTQVSLKKVDLGLNGEICLIGI